jgi:hypothetical protein
MKDHVPAVRSSDAGGFLPAMLQGEESKISDIGDIVARRVYADDTTGFAGRCSRGAAALAVGRESRR